MGALRRVLLGLNEGQGGKALQAAQTPGRSLQQTAGAVGNAKASSGNAGLTGPAGVVGSTLNLGKNKLLGG